jgi:hypothetical protein
MSSIVARITVVCVSLVVLWSILAGSGHAAIDPESIIAIWTFEEGRGEDVKDVSGNGNDGVVLGKPRWVNGKFGMALSLDGQGNVVQIDQFGNVAPTKEVTITIWVLVNGVKNQDLLSFDPMIGVNRITIHWPWNQDIVWQHGTDQHNCVIRWNDEFKGDWEFWAFVGSTKGNYLRIFRNMEEVCLREDAPEAKPAFKTSPQTWNIGGRRGSSVEAIIDEVGVFNTPLGDEDLTRIMEKGLEGAAFAVSPAGKMAALWGRIKARS